MTKLTTKERKEKLQYEIEKRRRELKEIEKKERAGLRKERIHRLCQLAGELDSLWPKRVELMSEENFNKLLKDFRMYVNRYKLNIQSLYPEE